MSAPKWTLCAEIPKPQCVTRKLLRPDGSLIALVSSSATDAEAQMLGAASELFEALRELREACDGYERDAEKSANSEFLDALDAADIALTRARGSDGAV